MAGPPAPAAQVRRAVRRALADLGAGDRVLVACSGGRDSLALLGATAFAAREPGWLVGMVTVDHDLQEGSGERAHRLAGWARSRGLEPVEVLTVVVGRSGGLEAAARTARYAALDAAAIRHGAAAVLLAHTLDDQAETVLLGLARGSGARSLAGMPARRGVYRRPLLAVSREVVRAALTVGDPPACDIPAWDIPAWDDPQNSDPARARARVRAAMPRIEQALGPNVTHNLARTARLLRADADLLEELAAKARAGVDTPTGLDVDQLAALPEALRTRVIRSVLLEAGSPGGGLAAAHVAAVDALVTGWHGQGPVALPRGVVAARRHGRLLVTGPG